jgi:nucleotide-binding universal stress UspA family protein
VNGKEVAAMVMRHITVGYDGSRASEYAVRWAVREAAARDTVLLVLTACPPPRHPEGIASAQRVAALAQVFRLQDKAIARATQALPTGLGPPLIGREIGVAHPVAALYRAATRADLLILGSDRGEGLASKSIAGRVAARLSLRRRLGRPCPLIVIPTPRVTAADTPTVTMPAFGAALDVRAADRPLTRRIGHGRPVPASKVLAHQ